MKVWRVVHADKQSHASKKPRWTRADEAKLMEAHTQGMNPVDIAAELFPNIRTAKQISEKISRLRHSGSLASNNRNSSAGSLHVNKNAGMHVTTLHASHSAATTYGEYFVAVCLKFVPLL